MSNSELLNNYKQSIFQMADYMYENRKTLGWKRLGEMFGLDKSKITWFIAIGGYTNRNHNLLPEHYLEVAKLSDKEANGYLNEAVKDNLSPLQLRKIIRKESSKVKAIKTKVKTNDFAKNLEQLKKDLNGMNETTRSRAKALLQTL